MNTHPDSPWRKPLRSFSNGNCAELAAWRKPRRSNGQSMCVEAGSGAAVVGVRDTKLADSPVLAFSAAAWREFTARLKTPGG